MMKQSVYVLYLLKQELLRFVLKHVEDKNVEAVVEVIENQMSELVITICTCTLTVACLLIFNTGFARGSPGA